MPTPSHPQQFLCSDVVQEIGEFMSPYEILDSIVAFGGESLKALSTNSFWVCHLEAYFPKEHKELIAQLNATKALGEITVGRDDIGKKAFVDSARKFSKQVKSVFKNPSSPVPLVRVFNYKEEHITDVYFMKRVLGATSLEEFNRKLYDLSQQGLLFVAAKNYRALNALLSLYPSREAKIAAVQVRDEFDRTVLQYAENNLDSLNLILSLYPEGERFNAVLAQNGFGCTLLHSAAYHPDSLNLILSLYPEQYRLAAVQERDRDGTVLHSALNNPDSLKLILSLLPERDRLAAVQEQDSDGSTVLQDAVTYYPEGLKVILSLLPLQDVLTLTIPPVQVSHSNRETAFEVLCILLTKKRDQLRQKSNEYNNFGLFRLEDTISRAAELKAINDFIENPKAMTLENLQILRQGELAIVLNQFTKLTGFTIDDFAKVSEQNNPFSPK